MERTRKPWLAVAAALALAAIIVPARGWFGNGHRRATQQAVEHLPKELPQFFREGSATIAHCSRDADLFRLRAQPALRDAEVPEHFIDLELLDGKELPPTRSAFIAFCREKKLPPSRVGCAPYAIIEWTQRLTLAFAEHRRWPGNPRIRAKCLVYAGLLAHYAQDACQPLHTTIHYDGRAKAGGSSPRAGIHARVDAILEKAPAAPAPKAEAYDDLFAAVAAEIKRSHALVESLYKLEKHLPAADKPLPADSPAAAMARERLGACANFTSSLYLTAWRNSGRLELPDWHERTSK